MGCHGSYPRAWLLAAALAALAALPHAAAQCTGLDFLLQSCGDAGEYFGFQQGVCYAGSIAVSDPQGSFSWASTSVSCSGSGCAWNCYSDATCGGAAAECATGYSALSCSCINVNTAAWKIYIANYQIVAWQGNVTSSLAERPADDVTAPVPITLTRM